MEDFLDYFNDHLILFLLSVSLLVMLFVASRIKKKDKYLLFLLVLSTLLLVVFEYLEILFNGDHVPTANIQRYIFSIICYILRPIIIVLFFYIRFDFKDKRGYLVWSGVIFNTIVYLFAIFAYFNHNMRYVFWYYDNNSFSRTRLGYTVYGVCAVYLVALIVISAIETAIHKTRRQIDFIIILTALMVFVAQGITTILKLDYSHTSDIYIIGATLYFMYLNYDKGATEAILYERDMQEKTTALMLSQIQPHFIYNTLSTIQVLCEIDSDKAVSVIEDFSKYLRMNTDALSKKGPVPVTEELNHAMAYANIEMIRFDNVKVRFIIKDKDFNLPVLTIEPLLENAIKYGVRARDEGIVEVKTYKEDNKHYVVIKDNGIGFDLDKPETDGKSHVGIINVRTRVINMVHGTFDIESKIDEGTTITITVPDEEPQKKKKNNKN